MKRTLLLCFVWWTLALPINAAPGQQAVQPPPPLVTNQIDLQAILATQLPDGLFPATIAERTRDSRRWERVSLETNRFGMRIRTNSWQELATGMHSPDPVSGQWVEPREEIQMLLDGTGAAATNGPHQLYLPADIYQ